MSVARSEGSIDSGRILVLEPGRSERHYWRDLWEYRELFWILAWRDVAVRYKQTVIGIAWAVIRPFLTVLIFTIVFSRIAQLPSEGAVPYPLMVFAGMLPWFLFSTILGDASNSLVVNSSLVGKIYFPRMIIPVSSALVAIVDFAINLALLIGIMVWYNHLPDWHIIFVPPLMIFALAVSLGPGLLLTALNVKFRDFRYVIPFILQIGLYLSPVGFSSSVVPDTWRFWYSLNPMVGVIDGFRWSILRGESPIYIPGLFLSLAITAFFLWLGFTYFRRTEKSFADLI
jgi:lipopolysaccharide transport system permease protein